MYLNQDGTQVPLEPQYLSTRLHYGTAHKNVLLKI